MQRQNAKVFGDHEAIRKRHALEEIIQNDLSQLGEIIMRAFIKKETPLLLLLRSTCKCWMKKVEDVIEISSLIVATKKYLENERELANVKRKEMAERMLSRKQRLQNKRRFGHF